MRSFELLFCVVNAGHGSKTLTYAKQCGVRGGTICMGKGVVKSKLLEFLDIADIRKEIVIMVAERELALAALKTVSIEMAFNKPHHGIGFAVPLDNFIGTKHHQFHENFENKAVRSTMYNVIFTVVDRGFADDVVDKAKEAGARGGTIVNARGSGIHDIGKLFAMPIEPEKEIVLIVSGNDLTKPICDAIREGLEIDKPGHGVIFVLGIDVAYGLYK